MFGAMMQAVVGGVGTGELVDVTREHYSEKPLDCINMWRPAIIATADSHLDSP